MLNKSILVAALLGSFASAHFSISHPVDFVKAKLFRTPAEVSAAVNGAVTWKSCTSDGGFKTDFTNTRSNPLQPVKGKNVDLILQGVWTDDANLDAIKVYCEWNGTPLYQEEVVRGVDYSEGDVLKDTVTWFIPGFAPSGHYTAKLFLHDKGTTTNYACIQADFDM